MSSYLSEIEDEYSRGRGRSSRLSPIDWNLGQSWEDDGIPLRIVLSAMGDGFKKFAAQNRKDEISSLRYFIPMINKQFAEWQTSQVGKSPEQTPIFRKTSFEEIDMKPSFVIAGDKPTNENVEILDGIAIALTPDSFERQRITLPEPLQSAVINLRGEILALLDDATQKQTSTNEIENRLTLLRDEFETHVIVSVPSEERALMIEAVKTEYGKYKILPELE